MGRIGDRPARAQSQILCLRSAVAGHGCAPRRSSTVAGAQGAWGWVARGREGWEGERGGLDGERGTRMAGASLEGGTGNGADK